MVFAAVAAVNIAACVSIVPPKFGWGEHLLVVFAGIGLAVGEIVLAVVLYSFAAECVELITWWWQQEGSRVRLRQIGAVVGVFVGVFILTTLALRGWSREALPPGER
ncbi:MAG TPA: hypothetical protein VKD22_15685 [Ramlibacter sp.]|nr:hypothetical protein [Ramlibacter sp.]